MKDRGKLSSDADMNRNYNIFSLCLVRQLSG